MCDKPKLNLLNLDLDSLKEFFVSIDEKPFRAVQVLKWVHQQKITDFDNMLNLSKDLREKLKQTCEIVAPSIHTEKISSDGTIKWLMQVQGNLVETVFIPELKRGTLCISSQVGCILNCTFCSTATQGFNRNLTTAEIIGQIWQAENRLSQLDSIPSFDKIPKITNVVMMGMGEPLFNFKNVAKALKLMRDDNAYGLAKRRVTVSTAGVVPGIDDLTNLDVEVALAISLHAPTDELRSDIMAINKKYPIKELFAACKRYLAKYPKNKITIEYVTLKGVNDSPKHAKQLARLLSTLPSKVNIIPFNSFPGNKYQCSNKRDILNFSNILQEHGLVATIRKTRGDDIDAACGQLRGKIKDITNRNKRFKELNTTTKVSEAG